MPPGVRLIACDDVVSTNAEALRRQHAGDDGPLWVWARSQSGGRGRQRRRWISEPGNLYASMLLSASGDRYSLTQLSFVAGLAVFDTAARLLAPRPVVELALKWPNDLLLDGAKLAGVLLESEGGQSGRRGAVVIGIGLNLASSPDTEPYRSTCLARHGIDASPGEAMELLSICFSERLERWAEGRNFSVVLADWKTRAAGLGEAVTLRGPSGDLSGTFTGLDDDGALLLSDGSGGIHRILSGDLFLERARDLSRGGGRAMS